jgi:hypothetical protein
MTAITVDMLDAIKVQWLKPIFEDDFPERGMTAWLTAVEWEQDDEGYKLYFDFSEFEAGNAKYFREVYFPNRFTGTGKSMFTALEAGQYTPKYSVYFSCGNMTTRDDEAFAVAIQEHLKVVE